MKTRLLLTNLFVALIIFTGSAQEVQSIFGNGRATGGYGALSNKFTTIGGEFANISEVYGGVFINRRWMIGLAFAGSTNDIRVPLDFSVNPAIPKTYQYGQGGLKLERVIGSNQPFHLVLNFFSGVGFTAQYDRYTWRDSNYNYNPSAHDQNWFYVLEPGAQLEMNLFRWMRLSPGVSYRKTYGSDGLGLSDGNLSDWTYNITVKFGGFGKRLREHSHESNSN
jgi:hypothetical protein